MPTRSCFRRIHRVGGRACGTGTSCFFLAPSRVIHVDHIIYTTVTVEVPVAFMHSSVVISLLVVHGTMYRRNGTVLVRV